MWQSRRFTCLVGAVMLAGGLAASAQAATVTVPGQFPSIQSAIDVCVDGDVIIVAPGVYLETIDLQGKAIVVRASNRSVDLADPFDPGHATILDGDGGCHVIQCVNGEGPETVLDGLTIVNGFAPEPYPENRGGGMINLSSSPTVMNCTFSQNMATYGGAMFNEASNPTISNCLFIGNQAVYGGAVHNATESSPVMVNVRFVDNYADMYAGAVYNWNLSHPILTNCTFEGNFAYILGGAMLNSVNGNPQVINCTFTGNSAMFGGALFNYASAPVVTNSILWGDLPQEIYDDSSDPIVTYSIIQGGYGGPTNIVEDPKWMNPAIGDLRLAATSPGIDAGNNFAVPADAADLDDDGDVFEATPLDLDGQPRFLNDTCMDDHGVPDTIHAMVDIGAFEFQPPCPADLHCSGQVNTADLFLLLGFWGSPDGDLNLDGLTDTRDLLILLDAWGDC